MIKASITRLVECNMQNVFSLINIESLEKAFKNGSNRLVFQHEISFSYFFAKMFLNEPKSYLVFVPNLYNGQNRSDHINVGALYDIPAEPRVGPLRRTDRRGANRTVQSETNNL